LFVGDFAFTSVAPTSGEKSDGVQNDSAGSSYIPTSRLNSFSDFSSFSMTTLKVQTIANGKSEEEIIEEKEDVIGEEKEVEDISLPYFISLVT